MAGCASRGRGVNVDLGAMPHLRELFDRLRSGRHLCAEDGPLYLALRAQFQTYRALFEALGFDLVQHDRGFYYFQSDAELGKEATQLAVFFFVLVESWGDVSRDIEETTFDGAGHRIDELPHFSRESWRRCMIESGTSGPEELAEVVRRLDRYGFVERLDGERFRFRTPAWRLLDLCREMATHVGATDEDPAEDEALR